MYDAHAFTAYYIYRLVVGVGHKSDHHPSYRDLLHSHFHFHYHTHLQPRSAYAPSLDSSLLSLAQLPLPLPPCASDQSHPSGGGPRHPFCVAPLHSIHGAGDMSSLGRLEVGIAVAAHLDYPWV
jgi:hypothetical protein